MIIIIYFTSQIVIIIIYFNSQIGNSKLVVARTDISESSKTHRIAIKKIPPNKCLFGLNLSSYENKTQIWLVSFGLEYNKNKLK